VVFPLNCTITDAMSACSQTQLEWCFFSVKKEHAKFLAELSSGFFSMFPRGLEPLPRLASRVPVQQHLGTIRHRTSLLQVPFRCSRELSNILSNTPGGFDPTLSPSSEDGVSTLHHRSVLRFVGHGVWKFWLPRKPPELGQELPLERSHPGLLCRPSLDGYSPRGYSLTPTTNESFLTQLVLDLVDLFLSFKYM